MITTPDAPISRPPVSEPSLGRFDARGRTAEIENPMNVGAHERWLTALGGGALAVYGLRRGGLGGTLITAIGGVLIHRAVTGHCPAYAAVGISTVDDKPAEPYQYFARGIHVEESVTINKPADELYRFWRNFENLPAFMRHLTAVTMMGDKKSHWVAKAPAGLSVAWDAEIIRDEPGAVIAWRSLGGASVDNAGSVRFLNGTDGRGTEVKVVLDYIPPGGTVGKWAAKLFGEDPKTQVHEDLRNFKRYMETGESPTTDGQSRGRG